MSLLKRILLISVFILMVFFINMFLGTMVAAQSTPSYMGPEQCAACHQDFYNYWIKSGHAWMLTPADKAKDLGIPLPSGISWDNISYVLGSRWKYRFINTSGYIITWHYEDGQLVPGGNQWNIELGRWVDYHAGDVKKYDCGQCHTTGYDPDGSFEGMPGIIGSWVFPGITCERCHGPGGGTDEQKGPHQGTGTPKDVLEDPLLCGQCHIRTSRTNVLAIQGYSYLDEVPQDLLKVMTDIDAKGGMVRHHEQFEEWYNSPHKDAGVTCQTCHYAHSTEPKVECSDCHTAQAEMYKDSLMAKVGVECIDCHMAKTVKSAEGNPAIYMGDVRSHLFRITTNPDATLTYKDPATGKEYGNTAIPLGWACASPGCHGVQGVSVSTAYFVVPSGWNTETAAEVVSNIQSRVAEELSSLKSVVSDAETELDNARSMGVGTEHLAIPTQLIEEAKNVIMKVEADNTYGVHNPEVIDELEAAMDKVSFALSLIKQAEAFTQGLDQALSTSTSASNTAQSALEKAESASETAGSVVNMANTAMMVAIIGIILSIIAIAIAFWFKRS